MPPRYLSATILAFWLVSTSWFAYRDIWPRLHSSDQPPFTINLEEEAKMPPLGSLRADIEHGDEKIGRASTAWEVYFNGQLVGDLFTLVRQHEDGQNYEMFANAKFRNFKLLRIEAMD